MSDPQSFSPLYSHPSSTSFLHQCFENAANGAHFADALDQLICSEYIIESQAFDLTAIQDSGSWRLSHLARNLAQAILDERGEFKKKEALRAQVLLENKLYSLGPERHHDQVGLHHMLNTLRALILQSEMVSALKKVFKPFSHPQAEKLIKETLLLEEKIPLTDAHARQAALSALFTPLRQNVGSCFATAPAILIQQELPLQFLADIAALFGTGQISRVYEGIDYAVPLNLSWGIGDLFRPISLKGSEKSPEKLLSYSPGLIAAFSKAGLINNELSSKEKQRKCLELLAKVSFFREDLGIYDFTPDSLIKAVLLHHFGITEEQAARFRDFGVHGPIRAQNLYTPVMQDAKAIACSRFQKAYDLAKGAFKGLTDNALLKAWEFTLASLSESKADFAKWNFFLSLGLEPQEPHGIGASLHEALETKLKAFNEELEEYQSRYDHLFAQAKYLEGRMRTVDSDRQAEWVQAEYQIRRSEINRTLAERDALYDKGRRLQGFYSFLVDFLGKKIRDYFQEVYDAEMHDLSLSPYDDTPAGFRLLYKHGRSNPSLWSLIYSANEYIQYLTSFFIALEVDLIRLPEVAGLEKEASEMITASINTIKKPEFLESSLYRLARHYGEALVPYPVENLEKVKRKPWSYVSGGTMTTLVSCYWKIQSPKESSQWVESPNELLAFYIDALKETSHPLQKKYQQVPNSNILAFSPTHAFLLKPGWSHFKMAWESNTYTYTWLRDHFFVSHFQFLDTITLDDRMQALIIQQLLQFIPSGYRPIVKKALSDIRQSLPPLEFRNKILKALSYEKWLQSELSLERVAEEVDSILVRFLPLFPGFELPDRLHQIFSKLSLEPTMKEKLYPLAQTMLDHVGKNQMLTAVDLLNFAKGCLILKLETTRTAYPFHNEIVSIMQELKFCYPKPLLIADTNWVKNFFGFTVNPGTYTIELWRFDISGIEGRPMNAWKPYLNGSLRKPWGLYSSLYL